MKKLQMSEKALTTTLCICAGVMVVTVVFLSAFAMVQSSRSKKNAVSENYSTTASDTGRKTTKSGVTTTAITTGGQKTPDPKVDPKEPTPDDPKKKDDPVDVSEMTFVMPCAGSVSRAYSPDKLVYSQTMNDYRSHEGIDVVSNVGEEVLAVADGTVTNIYTDPLMGNCVRIDHGNGLVSVYKNLGGEIPEGIDEGMPVGAGQTIGVVGDSAAIEQSDDAHLHLEMLLNGEYVDPADFVSVTGEEVYEG